MRFSSIIFDFDSTVVDCETLDLVSEVALEGRPDKDTVVAEVKRITALGMEGKLPFHESLSSRMALIAPSREHVAQVAAMIREHVTPSFLEHRDYLAAHAGAIYVVSGGFDELIFPVTDALGLRREHVFANAFIYGTDGIAKGVDQERPSAFAGGKTKAVEKAGLAQPRVIIGDGWTDYEIRRDGAAEAFIAYIEHAQRETVVAHADALARSFEEVLEVLENGPHKA